MYLITCLRKFIQKIIDILLSKLKHTKPVSISLNTSLFSKEQLYWIDKGLAAGIDVSIYAKTKYTADQMKIILYALLLEVPVDDIANYCLSGTEMEYNLYRACIEKYLGKDYLEKILKKGKYSIADKWIQTLIKEQLEQALSEVACTTQAIESEESKHLQKLRDRCTHRNINPYKITLDSIVDMNCRYRQEEAILRNSYLSTAIDICNLPKSYRISEIKTNDNLTEDDIPVYIYEGSKLIATYYTVVSYNSILLLGRGLLPLKLKRS